MRITEEEARQLGIEPECTCENVAPPMKLRGLMPSDPNSHYLFCPLGEWLKNKRALGEK